MLLSRMTAFAQPAATPPAGAQSPPASTSSQAPVAEIDAIAYDNLRNNAEQIYDAIGSLGPGFVVYQSQLFARLPSYLPALKGVDQLRQQLCAANQLPLAAASTPEASLFALTVDPGTALSGIAALLAVFRPSLTVTGIELPPGDQVLIADFANVAKVNNKAVYLPGVLLPNLEPMDPLANNSCTPVVFANPDPAASNPSILQEWQAVDKVARQLAPKLSGLSTQQLASPSGKQMKEALEAYAALAKQQTTTDASGNSPLAMLIAAGRLDMLLQTRKPLVLVMGVDDMGGSGWVKSKAFTVPVTYSGGASSHYYVFDSSMDSSVIAAGSVTSMNAGMDQKSINQQNLKPTLDKTRIVLPPPGADVRAK
jgi:hypothetical protein